MFQRCSPVKPTVFDVCSTPGVTLLNTAQLYHTSENCIGNGSDGWNRSEETETVEELVFRCICGFKQKARRPFILSQVLFQQRVRPILTNKQGLLFLAQKKQPGTDPKSQPPPNPLFFSRQAALRSAGRRKGAGDFQVRRSVAKDGPTDSHFAPRQWLMGGLVDGC